MNKLEEIIKGLNTISSKCEIAKKFLEHTDSIQFTETVIGGEGNSSFHPVNNGMVVLNDEYLFGFRCNHLVWISGFDEGYCNNDVNGDVIYVIANHKGDLRLLQIYSDKNK